MTIADLVNYLNQFDYRTEVAGTYEGIITPIEVYQAADGKILIDCDGGDSRIEHQKLLCHKCGEPARTDKLTVNRVLTRIEPVCYSCWRQLKRVKHVG